MLATVLLLATACDGGDNGADEERTVNDICEAYCAQYERCYPDYFEAAGSTQPQCRTDCQASYPSSYLSDLPAACKAPRKALDHCIFSLSCNDVDNEWEQCNAQWTDYCDCLRADDPGTGCGRDESTQTESDL